MPCAHRGAIVGPHVPTRRHKAPEQIGAAMQPLLDRLDREGHFAIVRLAKAWPEVVGDTIARRTEIVSLKFHTAVVKVSGAMWIQELNLMKSQILARVTRANRRRRRARTALRARTTEPPRASETAHRAACNAKINRAAGVERSRAAQSIRAPDRGLGPRLAMRTRKRKSARFTSK